MKRAFTSFLILTLCLMFYRDAEASPAVAVVAVAAGASLLVAAGATSYYQNSSGASAAVSAAGQVYSDVTAYTQGVSAVGQAVLYSQGAALSIAASDLTAALSKSATDAYQALKAALSSSSPAPSGSLPTGSLINLPAQGFAVKITGYYGEWHAPSGTNMASSLFDQNQGLYLIGHNSGGYDPYYEEYTAVRDYSGSTDYYNPPPLYYPPTALNPSGAGPIAPDVAKDINDLIKANPGIATPVTSGSAAGNVGGTTTVEVPYTPDLPAGSTVASNPSTTTATQIPTQDAAVDPPDVYPSTNAVELKKIDLRKWTQLYGVMQNTFPFSLLTTLSGYLDAFVTEPVAPSFDMHVYQDKKLHIDLSFFDPVAALVRWVIGILLTIGAILGMQKWWRGVS